MNQKKIQIGIILPSTEVPAWIYSLISEIKESGFVRISAIIIQTQNTEKKKTLFIEELNYLAYQLFLKLEALFFKPTHNAFKPENIKNIISSTSIFMVENNGSKAILSKIFTTLQSKKFDLLIQFYCDSNSLELIKVSKYGIWEFHYGNEPFKSKYPVGLWEVLKNNPVTESALKIHLSDKKIPSTIYQTLSPTHPYSVVKNINRHYWKLSSTLIEKLKAFYTTIVCENYSHEILFITYQDFYPHYPSSPPGNLQLLSNLLLHFWRNIVRILNKSLFLEQWVLLYNFEKALPIRPHTFRRLIPPSDRLWADPHLYRQNGAYYIFIEEKIYQTQKGHISYLKLNQNGTFTKPKKIIETSYHLSYPFLFEWDKTLYMIPESSANNVIPLYKCTDFPDRWEFVYNLMQNVCAVDATLFQYNQKWWLFTNIKTHPGTTNWDQLFLFYADHPLSKEWKPHLLNPIISDARRARPAGNIFHWNDSLIRPSQDCSARYGAGIRLNKILKLSDHEYEEVEIDSLLPVWNKKVKGTHTINLNGKMTILDAILKRRKF